MELKDIIHLTCEMCGKTDDTVRDVGYKLCPACDKELSKSIDAVEKYRRYGEEFDGGGGA